MTKVTLVGITQPNKEYTGCDTANELIAWAARVSNPSNQNNTKTASKLVQFLIREKHWSPFEMVNVSIEIRTTRDIARQILRHRSFAFQEYSQRYADPTKDLGFVTREARLQDKKNRQNSIELTDEEQHLEAQWYDMQATVQSAAQAAFSWAIQNGIAKEQARAVLPEGLTESVVIMNGSVRSWIHYCGIRRDRATQKEHREVADLCWEVIASEFPDVDAALKELEWWAEFEKKLP